MKKTIPFGLKDWAYNPPPFINPTTKIDVWREGWDDVMECTLGDIHPQTNVYGLYWRAAGIIKGSLPAQSEHIAVYVFKACSSSAMRRRKRSISLRSEARSLM